MQDAVRRHVGQCVSVVHGMPEPSARPFATKSDLVLSDAIFETTTPTITALCGRRTALQLGLRRRRRRRLVTQEREDRRVHVHRWKDRRSRAAPTHVATRCHSQFTRFSETRFSQNTFTFTMRHVASYGAAVSAGSRFDQTPGREGLHTFSLAQIESLELLRTPVREMLKVRSCKDWERGWSTRLSYT